MELANLKAVYDNSPVGFALGELEYNDQGVAVNFYIRYINTPGARILNSSPENLIDKPYIAMFPETDKRWITGFDRCYETGEKQLIKGFSVPLGRHLSISCFRCENYTLGCFIVDITNESTGTMRKYDQTRSMTYEEHQFSTLITRYAARNNDNIPQQNQTMAETMETISIFNDCIAVMTEDHELEESLQLMISRVCSYFGADKGSISLFAGRDVRAFWAAKGRCELLFIKNSPTVEALTEWTTLLGSGRYLSIPDCTSEQVPEVMRERCKKQEVHSAHLVPIFMDGLLNGFILLANVSLDQSQHYIMNFVVSTVSRLIHSRILQDRNRQMQFTDALTGHLNLEGFLRTAEKMIRLNPDRKYAIWYCDLKRFKYINDMFGYDIGDALLKYWARICSVGSREGETFGRAAADNFVLLRWYDDEKDIAAAFEKDEADLAGFEAIKSRGYTPELTCGIYLLNQNDMEDPDVNKIMDKANIAQQFTQNNSGAHYVIYDESMRQRQLRELDIGQHMSEGIREGEFAIWMQPQYDYVDGSIVGAEALVRWMHPQLGSISPAEFIPVLERTGQITELDLYVWEEACKYIRYTLDNADRLTAIPISINISRMDIYMADLEQVLLRLIRKYDLEPSMLRLEITESAYMENPEQLIEMVGKLQHCGFVIEMDDFGSGFSSLNILKDVPAEVLKLDMKFLAGNDDTGGRQGNILSSIIRMARWLGMELIAEGVETFEQAEYLKNLGCSYMQGYYFARPMPRKEFDEILSNAAVGKRWLGKSEEKKVFNTGQFLERQSEAAYIFNSCIGGAALLEYDAGRLEVILMNDLFLSVHDVPYQTVYKYWDNMFDFCAEESKEPLRSGVEAAVRNGTANVEIRPAEVPDKWIRASFRHLSMKENSHMFFVMVEDITHQKQIETELVEALQKLNTLMSQIPEYGQEGSR